MIALIIGNGDVCEDAKNLIPENAYIICADGGIRHMDKLGLKADLVIGDMDSADNGITDEKTIVYPVKKDFTDSELAVRYAIEHGYNQLFLLGFTGTRLDHTLSNIFLLAEIQKLGATGVIIDSHNMIYLSEAENEISGRKGDLVSIIPIGENVSGITTEGLEYSLKNETLDFGKSRGVSNVMTSDICRISIKKGKALIIKSKD